MQELFTYNESDFTDLASLMQELSGIHLTSSPRREAANALYRSMGFVRKEPNCYTMNLK